MKKVKYQLLIVLLCALNIHVSAQDIWVSPAGSDANTGTRNDPLASLQAALRQVRNLRRLNDPVVKDGVHIILRGGTYLLDEPVLIRPEDSGTESSPTIIEAANGEQPVFSGGIPIKGWKKASKIDGLPKVAQGNIWEASCPSIGGRPTEFRQLWIDGNKADRASENDPGKTLQRILSVDKRNQILWIPKPEFMEDSNIGRMEFFIHQWWAIAILRVKSVTFAGDSAGVRFWQPESRIEFEHPWPAPFIDAHHNKNGNSAFFFMNALCFLDRPGEWYQDMEHNKIYYWPRKGEDLNHSGVVVPVLENLVRVEGTADHPVTHIVFRGIGFQHATWMRPSQAGHVPLQAGMYLLDAYKLKQPGTPDKAGLENQAWLGRQSAGVSIQNASQIHFDQCSFSHMAATGIDFIAGTHHDSVKGCVFKDLGGTAIQMGFFGSAAFEAHVPYNPADRREVCSHELIADNLITNVTNEDWGCVGISVGYAHDITIEHNELYDLNYSGICVGWGWTKTVNCMKNNKIIANHIHHFAKNMYDVGGIYMLSAQPNTEISRNAIGDLVKAPYAHDPNHYQYIYFDEGSSFIRAVDNWTEKDKFFSNSPGPGNEWINNGPQVPDSIRRNAGLEKEYMDLMKK